MPEATAREVITLLNKKSEAAAAAWQQEANDFPPSAMAWMHHASWKGPVKVPLSHIDPDMPWMDGADPDHIAEFAKLLRAGKKVAPVILVKAPGNDRLQLVEYTHAFNFSEKINLGAVWARGEHLLLLNDDVEVLPFGWRAAWPDSCWHSGACRGL